MIWISSATEQDIIFLKDKLRDSDLREISLAGHSSSEEALRVGYDNGKAYVGLYLGKPLFMFGTVSHGLPEASGKTVGIAWLLGTDGIKKYSKEFIRVTPKLWEVCFQDFDILTNYIPKDNKSTINWLRRSGATFSETLTVRGVELAQFTIKKTITDKVNSLTGDKQVMSNSRNISLKDALEAQTIEIRDLIADNDTANQRIFDLEAEVKLLKILVAKQELDNTPVESKGITCICMFCGRENRRELSNGVWTATY